MQLLNLEEHKGNVTSIGFQKDRKFLFSASDDKTLKIWDLRCAVGAAVPQCRASHSACRRARSPRSSMMLDAAAAVNSAVLHPNQGELIFGDSDGAVRVWDLIANKCSTRLVRVAWRRRVGRALSRRPAWLRPEPLGFAACSGAGAAADPGRRRILRRHVHHRRGHRRQRLAVAVEWKVQCRYAALPSPRPTVTTACRRSDEPYQLHRQKKLLSSYVLRCRIAPNVRCVAGPALARSSLPLLTRASMQRAGHRMLRPHRAPVVAPGPRAVADPHRSPEMGLGLRVFCRLDLHRLRHDHCAGGLLPATLTAFARFPAHPGSSDQTARLWELSTAGSILTYAAHLKAVTAVALNDSPL